MKILFFTHEDLEQTAVAKAMFEEIAQSLSDKFDITLISAGEENHQRTEKDINYIFFKRRGFGKKIELFSGFLSMITSLPLFISQLYKCDKVLFRSYPSYLLMLPFCITFRKKIIFDTRGLWFHELKENKHINDFVLKLLLPFERILLSVASEIITVTNSQKHFYIKKHKTKEQKITTIPNFSKVLPFKNMTSKNSLSLLYVGSLLNWHSPNIMLMICEKLQDLNVNFIFNVYTKDIKKAKNLFNNINNCIIKEQNYRQYPEKHDFAFSIISGGISKEVCFPVKFSEYVNAGCRVISSSNVSETNELTNRYALGISHDFENESIEKVIEYILSNKDIEYEPITNFDFKYQLQGYKNIIQKK